MATRLRESSTGKARRRSGRRNSASCVAPQLLGVSAAERRKLAQEEAHWRAKAFTRRARHAESASERVEGE
jgi:hypothetical protein